MAGYSPPGRTFLIHPALPSGIGPVGSDLVPPLSEATLPDEWARLPDDEQERQLAEAWERAVAWAVGRDVDEVRFHVLTGDRRAREWLSTVGMPDGRSFVVSGAGVGRALREAFPRAVSLQACAGDRIVLEVYETWDGILVHLPMDEPDASLSPLRVGTSGA